MEEPLSDPQLGMIILAAGASTRMNAPKQLLPISGRTMLRHAVETARKTVFRPIVAVIGANAEILHDEADIGDVSVVVNENWRTGLSSSLKTGLRELIRVAPECDAALVVLADQPLISAEHLDRFARVFLKNEASVVAAEYDETIGVPALFSRETFAAFDQLEGDLGAKAVIRQYRENLVTISLPEAATDIDTPEDFQTLTG